MTKTNIDKKLLDAFYSKNVVVITGAGISTLSGIPDFRGKNGLYKRNINAEEILSRHFFRENPDEFYNFYKENMIMYEIEPNIIHYVLAQLEKEGYINCIITQNIDNLHQKAGSKNVIDLHGNGDEFYCTKCHTNYSKETYFNDGYMCTCGAIIRPDIVLYEEGLNEQKHRHSIEEIEKADKLIVLGSSLTVSTVSRLINYFIYEKRLKDSNNVSLFIVNNSKTPFDCFANKCEDDLETVFQKVLKYKK